MPAPRTVMTPPTERGPHPGLYRLLAWLSPSFPTGAFSYSHGLEAVVAGGAVRDRIGLEAWIAAVIVHGSGRIDADILAEAHGAAQRGDATALDTANRLGLAYRGSAELALEAAQPGAAFLQTCVAAWPDDFIAAWAAAEGREVCHAAAFGAGARALGALPPRLRKLRENVGAGEDWPGNGDKEGRHTRPPPC